MKYRGMNLAGLCIEALPYGGARIRVRPKGEPSLKISIPDGLSDDDFLAAYRAARSGLMTDYRPTTLGVMARRPGYWATLCNLLARSKQRANRKRLEFDVALNDLVEILDHQGGRCAISGMEFDIRPQPRRGEKRPFCMSIDRIDNGRGYTKDNVRITTVIANTALLNWKEEDFRRMCRAVAKRAPCPTLVSRGTDMGHAA
jgi:hypothetical protein